MRYSKIKIKNIIFDRLKENGLTPIDVTEPGGYFIFRCSKNSIFHFQIKEIPYWKFGLWIFDQKDEKCYSVELFGDKINWIDKFKPSHASISTETKVKYASGKSDYKEYFDPDEVVSNLADELHHLKYSRIISEYRYGYADKSFLKWYLSEFNYYNIKKPISEWYEDIALGWILSIISWWIGFKYRKYLKSRPVIDQHKEYFSPKWVVGVEYLDDCEEDDSKRIYFKLEDSRLVKFIDNQNACFIQYWDANDRRGFYYTEDERPK